MYSMMNVLGRFAPLSFLAFQIHHRIAVVHRRQELLQQVPQAQLQGAGIDAGVDADVCLLQQLPVDQQTHCLFPIVHEAQDT